MKIIITGGHFSPAYAIIQRLKDENDLVVIGRRFAFEGDKNETIEYKVCKDLEIPFINLNAGRIQRKISNHSIKSLSKFPIGIFSAFRILKKERPDVILTFGGYIALPVAIAAKALGIPVILHEQTQKAGISSKIIGKFANVVCVSFDSSRKYFKNKKVILTGNPIRKEIFEKGDAMEVSNALPNIYITGGSTGAHFINEKIFAILPSLISDIKVFIQTGDSQEYKDFEKFMNYKRALPNEFKKNLVVEKFFSAGQVSFLFKNVQLVVSRSGINTVLELIACQTIGFLIPLPYGQVDEQKDNAKFFISTGLGKYMLQDDITEQNLERVIRDMIKGRNKYKIEKENVNKYVYYGAADRIKEQVYLYGGKNRPNKSSKAQQN